ncbi:MAG: hypothetical protein GY745_01480 [Actinomycetia bacterium]|nr:hypothetical protein [Actinomycetes bacterium]MCP3909867.1 hypothetical protein [Actinomycetes bacterium]MCP4083720.1 hypothetical protein [Actinomycetes bacterium]
MADVAIERGDPGRMSRARTLYRTGAVFDLEITPGMATALVTGSEPTPYTTAMGLAGRSRRLKSRMVPDADDITFVCSCPDWGDPCKHGLALVLYFAESVEDDPGVLDAWLGIGDDTPDESIDDMPEPDPFLDGAWTDDIEPADLGPLELPDPAPLAIDNLEVWPVVLDAIARVRASMR